LVEGVFPYTIQQSVSYGTTKIPRIDPIFVMSYDTVVLYNTKFTYICWTV
jgi:hypothetical protein